MEHSKSMKDSLRAMWRTTKRIWKLDKKNLIAFVGNRILKVVQPFVIIVFTADLINRLQQRAPMEETFGCAAIWLLLVLILQLGERTTNAMITVEGYQLYWLLFIEMDKKLMAVDYSEVEDPALKRRMDRIEKQEKIYWCGPWEVPGVLMNLAEGVLTTVLAIGLTSPVFAGSGSGNFLNLLLILGGVLISAVFAVYSERRLYRAKEDGMDELLRINAKKEFYRNYIEPENGAKDIRIFGLAQRLIRECSDITARWIDTIMKRSRMQARYSGIQGVIAQLTVCCAYVIVGLQALGGTVAIGSVVQYIGALTRLAEGIRMLVYALIHVQIQGIHCKEYLDFLDMAEAGEKGGLPVGEEIRENCVFTFSHVSFRYPNASENALEDVSFTITPGKKLAVVGMNGSGKTTMIKLLCRLYEPTEGEILLNGVDIRNYNYKEYLKLISVVFQDFTLFALAVGENIAADDSYDEEKAWSCLEQVGMKKRVQAMKDGLQQPLYGIDEDGINISGGEAQKIAIARALYRDAKLVILDEPTAALDPIAEYEIYSTFQDMVAGRTSIYISHRLASCRFCDEILVFDRGRIVQEGSHDALVCREGRYAQLWNAQAQYYT